MTRSGTHTHTQTPKKKIFRNLLILCRNFSVRSLRRRRFRRFGHKINTSTEYLLIDAHKYRKQSTNMTNTVFGKWNIPLAYELHVYSRSRNVQMDHTEKCLIKKFSDFDFSWAVGIAAEMSACITTYTQQTAVVFCVLLYMHLHTRLVSIQHHQQQLAHT